MIFKICFFLILTLKTNYILSTKFKKIEEIKKERYIKTMSIISFNMDSLIGEVARCFNSYEARILEKTLKKHLPKDWHDPKAKVEILYINTQNGRNIDGISFSGSGKKIEIVFQDFEKNIIVDEAPTLSNINLDPKSDFDIYKLPKPLLENIYIFIKKLPKEKRNYKKYKKIIVVYSTLNFQVHAIVFVNQKHQKDFCILFNNIIVNKKGFSVEKMSFSNYFGLNIKNIVTSRFGYRRHPVWKTKKLHSGIDLRAPTGTPVHAAYNGVILFKGWIKGYGNCIKIAHTKRVITLYGHLSKLSKNIKVGQKVKKGTLIGLSGSTGYSTAPHLHFEVRINNKPVNPLKFNFFYYKKLSKNELELFLKFLKELNKVM
ncbi:M23 family metallopeptidase [Alphaproteobacteria bacterium endosymbiont of Tiliacea citrago]|uniref:M23 family metallopeptidase n=1 Tax=Alphaproteobacteria bacterium endosymbiont of Tiliacea citrago TaxID=3077944 RepID=UPI00313B0F23